MSKTKKRFVVQIDGQDAGLLSREAMGLGPELSFRAGLLVKKPNDPHVFAGEKSAQRVINKTQKTIKRLRESALQIELMPKLQPLLAGGVFSVRHFQQ